MTAFGAGGCCASTVDASAMALVQRNLPTKECGIEQHLERAEGLAAPFRPEADQHDAPGVERQVERCGLALQVLFADEITRQERRAGFLIARDHRALEPVLCLEYRAAVHEYRRFLGHAGHDRMRRVDAHLDDR